MQFTTRACAAALTAVVCLWPIAAAAQAVDTTAPTAMSVEQARSAFAAAGFQLEPTLTWDWTSPPVSTFRVHDLARDRLALVLVYPSSDDAARARGRGPSLVVGYGPGAWRGNVAIVQTTQAELDREFRLQNDRDNGVLSIDQDLVQDPAWRPLAVDLDLQQALDVGAVNL